jgi:hypothetical protein
MMSNGRLSHAPRVTDAALAGATRRSVPAFEGPSFAAGGTMVDTSPPKLAISLTRLELT